MDTNGIFLPSSERNRWRRNNERNYVRRIESLFLLVVQNKSREMKEIACNGDMRCDEHVNNLSNCWFGINCCLILDPKKSFAFFVDVLLKFNLFFNEKKKRKRKNIAKLSVHTKLSTIFANALKNFVKKFTLSLSLKENRQKCLLEWKKVRIVHCYSFSFVCLDCRSSSNLYQQQC